MSIGNKKNIPLDGGGPLRGKPAARGRWRDAEGKKVRRCEGSGETPKGEVRSVKCENGSLVAIAPQVSGFKFHPWLLGAAPLFEVRVWERQANR